MAALIDLALNAALVGGAISLSTGESFWKVIRAKFAWLIPHYLPLGALVASLSYGYLTVGAEIVPVFGLAAIGFQVAVVQYARARVAYEHSISDAEQRIRAAESELRRLRTLPDSPSEVA